MRAGSDNMRERAGLIIGITGVILLVKPNFDVEQIMMNLNYMIANYWPVGLILLGVLLINPRKKKSRSKSR